MKLSHHPRSILLFFLLLALHSISYVAAHDHHDEAQAANVTEACTYEQLNTDKHFTFGELHFKVLFEEKPIKTGKYVNEREDLDNFLRGGEIPIPVDCKSWGPYRAVCVVAALLAIFGLVTSIGWSCTRCSLSDLKREANNRRLESLRMS